MNKTNLLKMIAETGYNVGFGAKRNFATFDIVEKAPGWLSFISLVVGIYALFVPSFTATHVGAVMVIFSITTLYIGFYQQDKAKYEKTGVELTRYFHDLRALYYSVQSMVDGTDFTPQIAAHKTLCDQYLSVTVSKQIFLSDWYAHFKFFWQQQVDWINEQKQFKLLRDMIPLSFSIAVLLLAIGIGAIWYAKGLDCVCKVAS